MIFTCFFPRQHGLNAGSVSAADVSSHLDTCMVKKEVLLFSTRVFSFRGCYHNATVRPEGTPLLRRSRWEHRRNSRFLKMFCGPAIIWRRERSLCQQSHSSWPFVAKMRDVQMLACFPEALQVTLMRGGKFPPSPCPKSSGWRRGRACIQQIHQMLEKATTVLPGTEKRCWQTLTAAFTARTWTARLSASL